MARLPAKSAPTRPLRESGTSEPAGALRPDEIKVYGRNACRSLFEHRAGDIVRAYVTHDLVKEAGTLLRWCAAHRKAYHLVKDAELDRITASVHHEGVALVAKMRTRLNDDEVVPFVTSRGLGKPILWLDGVSNPHNVGAILRLGAHFGVPLVLGEGRTLPKPSGSLIRIAEGGYEHVAIASLARPAAAIEALKAAQVTVVAATAQASQSLYRTNLPANCLFIVGNETSGLSTALTKIADVVVSIPGTGKIESLNVAQATALLLGEYWRQHTQPAP